MPFFVGYRPAPPEPQPPRRLPTGAVLIPFCAGGLIDRTRYFTRAAAEAAARSRWPGEQVGVVEARNADEALAKLTGSPCSHWHHLALRYFTLPLNRLRRRLRQCRAL